MYEYIDCVTNELGNATECTQLDLLYVRMLNTWETLDCNPSEAKARLKTVSCETGPECASEICIVRNGSRMRI